MRNFTLAQAFARAARERRAAFIPYLVAGDPSLAISQRMFAALAGLGADVVEMGVPFSDPIADGTTIAAAATRALANGVRVDDVFELASHCSGSVAVVLFSYYNTVLQYGIERFAQRAAGAGVAAVIIPDLAADGAGFIAEVLGSHGLAMPLFVAPTTGIQRLQSIAAKTTGFVYVVSRLGVTGQDRRLEIEDLRSRIGSLRRLTVLPLAIGFGLRTPQDVGRIAQFADGAIVGSALIDAYHAVGTDPVAALTACAERLFSATAKCA